MIQKNKGIVLESHTSQVINIQDSKQSKSTKPDISLVDW